MKKFLAILIISALCLAALSGCAQDSVQEESTEDTATTTQAAQEETDEAESEAETEDDTWRAAYTEYLAGATVSDGLTDEEYIINGDSYAGFALIYVNEDEIPELVLYGVAEATGCVILTCLDGEIDEIVTNRIYFEYIEGENYLADVGGNNGETETTYYFISGGLWFDVDSDTMSEFEAYLGEVLANYADYIITSDDLTLYSLDELLAILAA